MRAQHSWSALLSCIALALQACAVAPNAYLTQAKLTSHDFLATDSRLRVIANAEQDIFSTNGIVVPKRILCTEPSPDVATTLANSLGVGISVFGYGSGSLTTQQVEGLVQLGERTAAIQLLRDKMYQTCLAYANGAVSGTTYSLLMNRLDDAIVTLSLGDSAGGAFGRKLAGLGGEASAKAEASVTGLPGEMSKIEDQAVKLAAANRRVDDAEKAIQAQKATQPAAGKEEEYKAQGKKLEDDLAAAKSERNALVELMRSTAKNAAEASGKISTVETGGALTARPNASALREMQADFLLKDVNRDLIAACLIELGLRDASSNQRDQNLQKMTDHLERLFVARQSGEIGAVYASAILRARGTALAEFCKDNLPVLIADASKMLQDYRLKRVQLEADAANARYAGDAARASAQERQLFIDSINLCTGQFKDDETRKKACLEQVIPIKK